jgi:hypothetical protein
MEDIALADIAKRIQACKTQAEKQALWDSLTPEEKATLQGYIKNALKVLLNEDR